MTQKKIDIFEVMKSVDARDINFYENIPADQRSSLAPVVMMRWLSADNAQSVHLMNYVLNPVIFPLYKHPGLLAKLMVACSDGKSKRHNWIKKKGKDKSAPTSDKVISEYYHCSRRESSRYRKLLQKEDILEMAEDLGYDSEGMKKIKAELK